MTQKDDEDKVETMTTDEDNAQLDPKRREASERYQEELWQDVFLR